MKKNPKKEHPRFEKFSSAVTQAAGSTPAFISAASLIIIWLAAGPFFHYSAVWQMMINTGTTIITFLMVFIIQKAQNKESLSIQLKLNELVASHKLASNRLISVEDMTEEELKVLQKFYGKLAGMTKKEQSLQESRSIEEAEEIHAFKKEAEKTIKSNRKSSPRNNTIKK